MGLGVPTGGRRPPTCQLVLAKGSFLVFQEGGVRGRPSSKLSAWGPRVPHPLPACPGWHGRSLLDSTSLPGASVGRPVGSLDSGLAGPGCHASTAGSWELGARWPPWEGADSLGAPGLVLSRRLSTKRLLCSLGPGLGAVCCTNKPGEPGGVPCSPFVAPATTPKRPDLPLLLPEVVFCSLQGFNKHFFCPVATRAV